MSLSRKLTGLGEVIDCQVVCFLGLQLLVACQRLYLCVPIIRPYVKYVFDARLCTTPDKKNPQARQTAHKPLFDALKSDGCFKSATPSLPNINYY